MWRPICFKAWAALSVCSHSPIAPLAATRTGFAWPTHEHELLQLDPSAAVDSGESNTEQHKGNRLTAGCCVSNKQQRSHSEYRHTQCSALHSQRGQAGSRDVFDRAQSSSLTADRPASGTEQASSTSTASSLIWLRSRLRVCLCLGVQLIESIAIHRRHELGSCQQ